MRPTAEYVRAALHYDPDTGHFFWKERPREQFATLNAWAVWNSRFAGKKAGRNNTSIYHQISIGNEYFQAHALAWLYMTGEWPDKEVDHINLDKQDNRWVNLRLATRSQNARNCSTYRTNTSGYKGVCFAKDTQKWQVQIRTPEGRKYLGQYHTIEEAAAVYQEAAKIYHGDFVRVA